MKKFILFIVMSLVFCTGFTSLTSCSDRIDDELTLIRMDISVIDSQLVAMDGLLAKYDSTILNNTNEINVLKNDLNTLKEDYNNLNLKVNNNETAINDIKIRISALEESIYNLNNVLKNAVTGVIVQETLDRVVGTINLPGFNPGFLAAYVGENKTGIPEFPINGSDYNADPNGNVLLAKEISGDPVWNSGKNSYLINGVGNAGKIYFTLNPLRVDANYMDFALVNSTGEESPIKLSDVTPSDHLITFAIGKHGNGLTRGETDNMTYLYEANATVYPEGIEQIHFDYTKFGYQNLWDAGMSLSGQTQSADANAQNIFGRFRYLINNISAGNTENVLNGSLKIIQDFYNGVYSQRNKLQKQALRVMWDNGSNAVVSGYDITTVTINPLNYKQMYLLDQMNVNWNLHNFDGIVNKIVNLVKSKMPKVTTVDVTWDTTVGKLAVYDTTNTLIGYVELQGEGGIITNLSELTNSVNQILTDYGKLSNVTGSGIMTRVNNFLNSKTASFKAVFDGRPAWRLTEPILLFEAGKYGITRLQQGMKFYGDDIPFIMTSATEEYIVPVYMKYIAVLYNGKVHQSYILPGNQKIAKLNIPNDKCEIIYQACDYYGNVITKRYPIN